jgi:hypothetical protein
LKTLGIVIVVVIPQFEELHLSSSNSVNSISVILNVGVIKYHHINVYHICCSKVKVHFVDFGNTEVISQREVVCLSHELYSHPPYAKQYKLNGVNDPKDLKLFIKVSNLSYN